MGWATLSAAANRVAFNRLGSVGVIAGAASGRGFLYMPGEYVAGDRVITTEYVLRAEASKFGSLAYDDSITVDGIGYTVREQPLLVDDGTFCLVLLTKAAIQLATLVLEAGGSLLLEDGSFLLLEA